MITVKVPDSFPFRLREFVENFIAVSEWERIEKANLLYVADLITKQQEEQ